MILAYENTDFEGQKGFLSMNYQSCKERSKIAAGGGFTPPFTGTWMEKQIYCIFS